MKRAVAGSALTLMLVGCASLSRPPRPPPVPQPPGGLPARSVTELAAAIAASAKRSDAQTDSKIRDELAAQASRDAAQCLMLEPRSAACLYGQGVALGLEARSHPTRASDLLKTMLASLADAEAVDPTYDEAGPARVSALVLIRAPSWPLGPGDTDAGLAAARRAAALRPQYPPNLLALAEAQAKSGDAGAARDSYARAQELAGALAPSPDRDAWLHEAARGLQGR